MRIGKHAKIFLLHYYAASPFLRQHSAILQTHRCQLNQSPWYVITFPIEDVENDNIINHHTLLLQSTHNLEKNWNFFMEKREKSK